MLPIKFMSTSCEIALWWIPQSTFIDESALFQVMVWYHQATSQYLSQCWPWFILSYGVTRPQFKCGKISFTHNLFVSCQIVLKFYTEHGNDTAILCTQFRNDLTTEIGFMEEQDFVRFGLRWVSDIVTALVILLLVNFSSTNLQYDVENNTWYRLFYFITLLLY